MVLITETVLRDAHQSQWATRMRTDDMLLAAELLNKVGYHSMEVWGGATFDACLRYLEEDPWDRLRRLREALPDTRLQMLLRGQNILGYHHYPDDVVTAFIHEAVRSGIDVVRTFDALNDVRNLEVSIRETKKAGAHAQAAAVYTTSPVHNEDYYVSLARDLESLGADSICIKDMAGLLRPVVAYRLVRRLKEAVSVPVQLHSHYSAGLAGMSYMKAVEAGADAVDTALSALAMGTSQPATEAVVAALEGTEYDTGLTLADVIAANQPFKELRDRYQDVATPPYADAEMLHYQIPGGMLSNLRSQLKAQGMLDKLPEVLREVPKVRRELGYPPLVTPLSQMVGTQAVLNVVTGERYSVVPKEVRSYARGFYGRPPADLDPEVKASLVKDEEVLEVRPADLLEPKMAQGEQELRSLGLRSPDVRQVLSYLLFPDVARRFFTAKGRLSSV